MLGAGKIDSLASLTLLSIGGDFSRSGAVRAAAAAIAASDPGFICLHGVAAGDALALATRFARGYAYRGAQAILWTPAFTAREVHDRYLPAAPLRPFDRRGILQVDGGLHGERLSLVATQFSPEREGAIRELRFARRVMRGIEDALVAFVAGMSPATRRIGFADLGLEKLAQDRDALVCARTLHGQASIVRV